MSCIKESSIKKYLKKNIINKFVCDPSSMVIDELGIMWGKNRVDIAVINDELHAYEIKSEKDTLKRLYKQAASYNDIFDKITIVVHEKHEKKLVEYQSVMENWGVLVFENGNNNNDIKIIKNILPKKNINAKLFCILHLLWKQEVIDIIKNKDSGVRGLQNKTRVELYIIVSSLFHEYKDDLKQLVIDKIKSREQWRNIKEAC